MRIIETKIYTINEHPNKELCFEWIRNNWHDLNSHSVDEVIDSLRSLQTKIGGDLEYAISQVSDKGEFITLTNYDQEALSKLSVGDYPLTGTCWDFDVIKGLREGNISRVLDTLHEDTEYVYSVEGLLEMCEANEYEFTEEGRNY